MNERRLTLWRRIVAVAPALLLVACLPGQIMLRCRLDGTLRAACCCPGAGDQAQRVGEAGVPAPSRLMSQGCCERTVIEGHRSTAEIAPHESVDAPREIAVCAPVLAVAGGVAAQALWDRAGQRHGPPREGPRLILLKQSFLI